MTAPQGLKHQVACEAATLLYFGAEKEYKQAKTRAAATLSARFLPSNLEVALELDRIAEENEGQDRTRRLVEMRRQALGIMKRLDTFFPVLIGSVWRGTIRNGSDIDIAVYCDEPSQVADNLKKQGIRILRAEWTTVNKHGSTMQSYHVYAETEGKNPLEVTVRAKEEKGKSRKCEVFGDQMKGLNTQELEKLLLSNPYQKFLPA